MKRILITGVNSYIGKSFAEWVSQYPDKYKIDFISLRDGKWKEKSFEEYDVVLHLAALVHVKRYNAKWYYEINRDLTIEVANKAKGDCVKQFIFLSTMGVYGRDTGYINQDTKPDPKTPYAKSKFEAEQYLVEMNANEFKVAILRPPIVYGKNCPGNYSRLVNLALKLPIFPDIDNERSMIYIDNLSEFIRLIIDLEIDGILFPQNQEYVGTTELVELIRGFHGKKVTRIKIFNWCAEIGFILSSTFRKMFGSFVYDKELLGGSNLIFNNRQLSYETVNFIKSIQLIECGEEV